MPMAKRLAGNNACTLCYFGDGAASEGDFHAGLNMAAVLQCPVVFVARNNGYAISTPSSEQFAGRRYSCQEVWVMALKPFVLMAMTFWRSMPRPLRRATLPCNEQRPVLIETMSYRLGAHSTSDDPSGYRSAEEEDEWRQKDPISRMKNWLINQTWWDESRDEDLQSNYRKEILAELKLAEKRPKATAFRPYH